MKNHRWKIALIATCADLIYIVLTIIYGDKLPGGRSVQDFFGFYLPFALHFPFDMLFYGANYRWIPVFASVQTFFIFFIVGKVVENNKRKSSLIVVSVFYIVLVGFALKGTWDDRIRETVNVVLPTGYYGVFSILLGQKNGVQIPLIDNKYIIEIPKDGKKVITNYLDGLHPFVFNYKDGTTIPYSPDNSIERGIACFDINERTGERRFFIGTYQGYLTAQNEN